MLQHYFGTGENDKMPGSISSDTHTYGKSAKPACMPSFFFRTCKPLEFLDEDSADTHCKILSAQWIRNI
jgi:hypothetical protein